MACKCKGVPLKILEDPAIKLTPSQEKQVNLTPSQEMQIIKAVSPTIDLVENEDSITLIVTDINGTEQTEIPKAQPFNIATAEEIHQIIDEYAA